MRNFVFLMVSMVAVVVVAGCVSGPQAIPPTSSGPDYTQQFAQLNQTIAALNTKVGQVEAGVSTTTQAVQALTAKVTQVEGANAALDTRVGQTEAVLQSQQQATTQTLQRLEQGLRDLQSALSGSAQANPGAGQSQQPVAPSQTLASNAMPMSRAVFGAPSEYFAYVAERPHDLWGYSRLLEINNNSNAYVNVRIDNRKVLFIIRRGGILNPNGEILLPPHQKAWCLLERLGIFEAVAEGFEETHPGAISSVPLGQTRIPFKLTEDLEQGILISNFN